MVIGVCAGGTLGHLTPALNLTKEIKQSNKIILITTIKEKNYDYLFNQTIDKVYYLDALGISKNIFQFPKICYKDLMTLAKIKQIIKNEKIELMIGMGGYISGLGIFVANKLQLTTIIHEQNSILGLANQINLNKTNYIFLTYENQKLKKKYFDKIKVVTNPRYLYTRNLVEEKMILNDKHLLICSGTNGSKFINDICCKMIKKYSFNHFTVTFITGKKYYEQIKNQINQKNVYIKPFSDDLAKEIVNSNIIISRAGSSTLFEILGAKKKSIIIPSPNVSKNHQYFNAIEFERLNYIKMFEEKDLNEDILYQQINQLLLEELNILNLSKYNTLSYYIKEIIKRGK